jgi:hypothetical protein
VHEPTRLRVWQPPRWAPWGPQRARRILFQPRRVKNTATAIPTPQNATQHLLPLHEHPLTLPNPPLKHTRQKPSVSWLPAGTCQNPPGHARTHPCVNTDTKPQDTPHVIFPCKLLNLNHTPTNRHKHTHWGARAPKQRVRPPHRPTHNKRPTDREADRAFSLFNHRNPTQTDQPRLTPSYHRPPRFLRSHRDLVSQPTYRQLLPHTPLISPGPPNASAL